MGEHYEIWDHLDEIRRIPPGPEHDRELEAFYSKNFGLAKHIARQWLVRIGGVQSVDWYHDEMTSEVADLMMKMVNEYLARDEGDRPKMHFIPDLHGRARNRVRGVFARAQSHTDRGAIIRSRRREMINKTTGDLFNELGREPNHREVIAEVNRRLSAWKNPSSFAVTDDDFVDDPTPIDETFDESPMGYATAIYDTSFTYPGEDIALVKEVLERCAQVSPELGDAAKEWAEANYIDHAIDERRTLVDIANIYDRTPGREASADVLERGTEVYTMIRTLALEVWLESRSAT